MNQDVPKFKAVAKKLKLDVDTHTSGEPFMLVTISKADAVIAELVKAGIPRVNIFTDEILTFKQISL